MDIVNTLTPLVALAALVVALINRKGERNEENSLWRGKVQQEVDSLKLINLSREVEVKEIIAKQAQFGSEIKTLFEKNREQDKRISEYSSEIKQDFKSLENKIEGIKTEIKNDVQNIVNILKNANK